MLKVSKHALFLPCTISQKVKEKSHQDEEINQENGAHEIYKRVPKKQKNNNRKFYFDSYA